MALGLTLTAAVAVGGIGLWWQERAAADRRAERQVEAARGRQAVELALDQAEVAFKAENLNIGEIDAALNQAEHRINPETPTELRVRFDELKNARRFLDRLAAVDQIRWSISAETRKIDVAGARAGYESAFKEYGLDLTEPPDVLAARSGGRSWRGL